MSTAVRRSPLPPLLWLAGLGIVAAGELVYALNEFNGDGPAFVEAWFLLLSSLAVITIGTLILRQLPGHVIGWLLYAIGMTLAASSLMDEWAIYATRTVPGTPLGRPASVLEIVGATAF